MARTVAPGSTSVGPHELQRANGRAGPGRRLARPQFRHGVHGREPAPVGQEHAEPGRRRLLLVAPEEDVRAETVPRFPENGPL